MVNDTTAANRRTFVLDPGVGQFAGRLDLVCTFRLADADFQVGDTLGLVTGALYDGRPFMAADRVRII